MGHVLEALSAGAREVLLVVAASAETRAILAGAAEAGFDARGRQPALTDWEPRSLVRAGTRIWVVQSGVGKVNGACAALRFLTIHPSSTVLNLGICGLLPASRGRNADAGLARSAAGLGKVILASRSIYADEGVVMAAGFTGIGAMGFPLGGSSFGDDGLAGDAGLLATLRPFSDVLAPIATVSTCSGTDALAQEIGERTGAMGEGMEGAGVGHAVARFNAFGGHAGEAKSQIASSGARFAEMRVVSNTTGSRERQVWDISGACDRLRSLVRGLLSQ